MNGLHSYHTQQLESPLDTISMCIGKMGKYDLEAFYHFMNVKQYFVAKSRSKRDLRKNRLHLIGLGVNSTQSHGYAWLTTENTDSLDSDVKNKLNASVMEHLADDLAFLNKLKQTATHPCTEYPVPSELDGYVCKVVTRKMEYPFTYTISRIGNANQSECEPYGELYLISEYQNGIPTKGGSTFHVTKTMSGSSLLVQCNTQDHFNGNYTVKCPCLNGCFNVSIIHVFHDFLAFAAHYTQSLISRGADVIFETSECAHQCAQSAIPGWGKAEANTWRWFEKDIPSKIWLSTKEEKSCLHQFDSITIIGSSHCRFLFNYFEVAMYGSIRSHEKDVDLTHGKLNYLVAHYIADIRNQLSVLHRGPNNLAILMTGTWDLEFKSLEHFIRTSQATVHYLRQVYGTKPHNASKLIWMTAPATPDKFYVRRNNAVIRAVIRAANAYLAQQLRGLHVESVDTFAVTQTRNSEHVRRSHYFAPLWATDYFVGSVGYAFVNELVRKACDFD